MEEVNGTKRNDAVGGTEQEVPVRLFSPSGVKRKPSVDMTQVVGTNDILMICLDTLRYDAAVQEEEAGNTPVLNQLSLAEMPGSRKLYISLPSCHVCRVSALQA